MSKQTEAAGAVNTDGQEVESALESVPVYSAAGYLVNGCVYCPAGVRFVVPLVHCHICGAGVCGLHVTHYAHSSILTRDLCPRCAVPKPAGDLRRLWDGDAEWAGTWICDKVVTRR